MPYQTQLSLDTPALITPPTSTDYRDCRQILIRGIHLLLLQNPDDLPPSGDETNRDGRQVIANLLMQSTQFVAGDRSVHMMLNMKVHVPIEKTHERIQEHGASTEAKIRYIVSKTYIPVGHINICHTSNESSLFNPGWRGRIHAMLGKDRVDFVQGLWIERPIKAGHVLFHLCGPAESDQRHTDDWI